MLFAGRLDVKGNGACQGDRFQDGRVGCAGNYFQVNIALEPVGAPKNRGHGIDAFHRLCREMRDGRSFEEALANAYPSSVSSLAELETRWLEYLLE